MKCKSWEDRRLLRLTEEMCELTKAICRLARADSEGKRTAALESIIEKTASVSAMLAGMQVLLGIEEQVQQKIRERIHRAIEREAAQ